MDRTNVVDAGTLLKRLKVTLPLLRTVNVDRGLIDLLLNHLVAVKFKSGSPLVVPRGLKFDVIPPEMYHQERRVLASSNINAYDSTARALQ